MNTQKYSHSVLINYKINNKLINFHLITLTGNCRSFIKGYFRRANGVILVYSITDYNSFKSLTDKYIDYYKKSNDNNNAYRQ